VLAWAGSKHETKLTRLQPGQRWPSTPPSLHRSAALWAQRWTCTHIHLVPTGLLMNDASPGHCIAEEKLRAHKRVPHTPRHTLHNHNYIWTLQAHTNTKGHRKHNQ
jgi:hypothetical protein